MKGGRHARVVSVRGSQRNSIRKGVFNQVIDSFVRQGVQTTVVLLARSIFHFLVSPPPPP
jgi:hypothetical protein